MYMERLNMHRFRDVLQAGTVETALIPIGMTEAHGEHCALGTDFLIPREFVRRLDTVVGDKVMMTPEIPFGHSWSLASFPGTLDIPGQVFADYVSAVGEQLVRQGFHYVVLFNGHGGNMPALSFVSERLADLGATVLSINWWMDYRDLILPIAPDFGHAGEDETSCVMAIDESLVNLAHAHRHMDSVSRKLRFSGMEAFNYPHANNGDATKATVEKGLAIYEALVPAILQDLEDMWNHAPKAHA
jgi:creatinine amidohydrolase